MRVRWAGVLLDEHETVRFVGGMPPEEAPLCPGQEGGVVDTGVAWCSLTVGDSLLDLAQQARSNEAAADGGCARVGRDRATRLLVASGVTAAAALAEDASLDLDGFLGAAFELRGRPWSEARARRDMRERIRLYRRIAACGGAVPRTPDDLLALWTEANAGEVPIYDESETAQFRKAGVPFAHGETLFDPGPVPPGYETLEPEDIPGAVEAMLAFCNDGSAPVELRAGAAHFLCGHVHPFRDGNGRTARMLACLLLADGYSPQTLLALVRALQEGRGAMGACMANTVLHRADLEGVVKLFLELLCSAQCGLANLRL